MKSLLILIVLGLSCRIATAEIYKSVDEQGTIVYSSRPSPDAERHPLSDKQYPATREAPAPAQKETPSRQEELPAPASPAPRHKIPSANDYRIIKHLVVQNRTLIVSGRISGGPDCKTFTIKAMARHSTGRTARLSTTAGPLGNGILSALYEAQYELPDPPPGPWSAWSLESLTLRCQER